MVDAQEKQLEQLPLKNLELTHTLVTIFAKAMKAFNIVKNLQQKNLNLLKQNYKTLYDALPFLKDIDKTNNGGDTTTENGFLKFLKNNYIYIIVGVVVIGAGTGAYFIYRKKRVL